MSKFGNTLVSMRKIVIIYSNCVVSTALHETGNWKGGQLAWHCSGVTERPPSFPPCLLCHLANLF